MHKKEHNNFVEVFKKFKRDFYLHSTSQEFTIKLTRTIIAWVANYIKGSDVEIGKYYREQNK